jgi:threonine/homoserine/homoserine lactone efflux protein
MDMFFDILIMACGVYMIYWAVQMKRERKIPEMLVGKGFKIERAKDPEGFMNHTFPFTFGTGVILFVAGLYLSLSNVATEHPFLGSFISLLLVVLVIVYGVILMKAQKKYLVGIDKNGKKL